MATTTSTATTNATEGSKSATTNAVKTQRVLETRDQWSVIYNHCLSLVVTLAKGKALPTDSRKGFAFETAAKQPHSRAYAQSLLAGFASKKAGKVLAQTESLKEQADRTKIAIAILLATKLGGTDESKAKAILSKAEPKQAKTFATAVLTELADAAQKAVSEAKADDKQPSPSESTTKKSNAASSTKKQKSTTKRTSRKPASK